jgi:lipopolysaccharide export system permease protein
MLRRIGQTLPLVLLPLLALGLVASNPRSGRAFHLLAGILIYTTYTSFSTVAEAQVSRGQWSLAAGLVLVHGSFACAVLLLFGLRLGMRLGPKRG